MLLPFYLNTPHFNFCMNPEDLVGQKFGQITVLRLNEKHPNGYSFTCVCDCGTEFQKRLSHLIANKNQRCSNKCSLSRPDRKYGTGNNHGMTNSPEYNSWRGMKNRCYNPNESSYEHYGSRGITVCQRWLDSFEDFYEDLGSKPSSKHSIDRIDVNGNYEPGNCQWATQFEQNRNRTISRIIEFNGVSKSLAAWAEEYNLPRDTLKKRLDTDGWSIEKSLTHPIRLHYTDDFTREVQKLRSDGASFSEIMATFNIASTSLRRLLDKKLQN